jgi:hypothetical protein
VGQVKNRKKRDRLAQKESVGGARNYGSMSFSKMLVT